MTTKKLPNRAIAPPTLRRAEPLPRGFQLEDDDQEWSERGSHWAMQLQANDRRLAKREKSRKPLTLAGHGVSLKVDAGTLLIRNGFTRYPQKQETYRYFKGDAALPSRIVMLDGSGSITFDVLSWLSEQNIPLVRIDWTGEVISAIFGYGYAANPHRVAWQVETVSDHAQRMEFSNHLIARKIEGCILTL